MPGKSCILSIIMTHIQLHLQVIEWISLMDDVDPTRRRVEWVACNSDLVRSSAHSARPRSFFNASCRLNFPEELTLRPIV